MNTNKQLNKISLEAQKLEKITEAIEYFENLRHGGIDHFRTLERAGLDTSSQLHSLDIYNRALRRLNSRLKIQSNKFNDLIQGSNPLTDPESIYIHSLIINNK